MTLAELITVLAQVGLGAAAWRLANQLRVRVDDHESRIKVLEAA
jgi:hypothetical protein